MVVLDPKTGEMKPMILEQGPQMYKDFKELTQDYDLSETMIKIKRTGSKLDTTYSVIPLPKKPEKKTLDALKKLELHPLTDSELKESMPNFDSNEEVPF